jgi:hypothetical protein
MNNFSTKSIAFLLVFALLAPSLYFAAPSRVEAAAAAVVVVGDTSPSSWIQVAKTTISAIADPITAAATVAKQINDYVLMPIAFIKSGLLLKALTAGVVAFVTGKANGTGAPQFVQNLGGNLQRVGDIQAMAFFAQFARNSNSPFAASIMSSLRTNYLLNTSAAGFWAANRSTLNRYSPNVNAFLAGNWSQGGVGAWLALTTQPQNNPYLLYSNSQRQMGLLVGNAQANRVADINRGQGFMSWCGPSENAESAPGHITEQTASQAQQQCLQNGGSAAQCQTVYETYLANVGTTVNGVSPGDACLNKDGTPGVIKTPGSVITAGLNKALGGGQDKLVQVGQIGSQIGTILQSIATIMGTINLAKDVLSGPSNTGLAGAGSSQVFSVSSSAGANAAISGINAQGAALNGRINEAQSASTTAATQTQNQQSGQSTEYTSAWNTIKNAAVAANSSVTDLKNFCTSAANANSGSSFAATANTQAAAAQSALSSIAAVISQADSALAVSSPSSSQLNYAIDQSGTTGGATANPSGSLSVSGGTLIDQMNLMNSNAPLLKSVCTPSTDSGG